MKRAFSLFLLAAFLNLEISYAVGDVITSTSNRGKDGKKTSPTESNFVPLAGSNENSAGAKRPATIAKASNAQPNQPPFYLSSNLSWPQSEIDSLLASFSVPPANIPVLENALGDVVQDSVVNIFDLLRLRDITIRKGPAASAYEMKEGDLNQNKLINEEDVSFIRDILLRKSSIPHIVDSTGGSIQGSGVSIVVPPNGLDSTDVVIANKISGAELNRLFGVNPIAETKEENYLFGTYEIRTEHGAVFQKPFEISVRLDSMPPCRFQGLNGLFEVLDDMDGDGRAELVLRNLMHPSPDSTNIVSNPIPKPSISTVHGAFASTRNTTANFIALKPGQILELNASNLPNRLSSIVVKFTNLSGRSIALPPYSYVPEFFKTYSDIIGIRVLVPFLNEPGITNVAIHNLINGQASESVEINILPLSAPPLSAQDTLIEFFTLLDSMYTNTASCENLRSLYNPLTKHLNSALSELIALNDSIVQFVLPILDEDIKVNLAGIIINSGVLDSLQQALRILSKDCSTIELFGLSKMLSCDWITKLGIKHAFVGATLAVIGGVLSTFPPTAGAGGAIAIGGALDMADGVYIMLAGSLLDCKPPEPPGKTPPLPSDNPPPANWQGPTGPDGGNRPTGGIDPDGRRKANGCCVNIYRYGQNLQGSVPPLTPGRAGGLSSILLGRHLERVGFPYDDDSKILNLMTNEKVSIPISFWESPLKGAVIAPTNVRAPYGIVGIIGPSGNWVIPHLPLNTDVTLGIYDPKTGYYDPDAATIHTLSAPGAFGEVLATFTPNIAVSRHTLSIGQFDENTVSTATPRHEFHFYVPSSAVGSELNIGLRAEEPITFWLKGPSRQFIVKDSSANCKFVNTFIPTESGTYQITVSYGFFGGDGPFAVGISYTPDPPIPYLCGDISLDVLYTQFSPYISADPSTVLNSDTLNIEAGTAIEFQPGGDIAVNGIMQGTATRSKPIILKPVIGSNQQTAMSFPRSTNKTQRLRRDGQK